MRLFRDLIGLFFTRCCSICGELLVGDEHHICSRCLLQLPEACNAKGEENYVEQRLMGRIPVVAATSLLLFRRGNDVQTLLHQSNTVATSHWPSQWGANWGCGWQRVAVSTLST